MAENNVTADRIQIEIEANSAQAAENLRALTAALKEFQAATRGKFGDVTKQIKDINDATIRTLQSKIKPQVKRETAKPTTSSVDDNTLAIRAGRQLNTLDSQIEKAKNKIAELGQQWETLTNAVGRNPHVAQQLEETTKRLEEQKILLEALRKERERQENILRGGGETKGARSSADVLADFKERIKGTTLAGMLGDVSSIDEAIAKMGGLTDQTSILEIKLIGLREKLQAAFERGNLSQIANYTAQIQKLQSQILDSKLKSSGKESVVSETSAQKELSIWERVRDTLSQIKELHQIINKLRSGTADGGTKDEIKEYKEKLRKFKEMKSALSSQRSLWSDIAPKNIFGGIKSEIAGLMTLFPKFATVVKGLVYAFNTVTAPAKKLFSVISDGVKQAIAAIGRLIKSGIGKLGGAVKGIGSAFVAAGKYVISDFTKPFQNAIKAVTKWKNAIGRIIFYRVVRGAIKAVTDGFKTGIENLYQYSRLVGTEFAPAMNKLATSSLYLKNSLGAMAAPLIQALAPVVDMLIDKFVALLNIIGKVFATLTGKSVYTQAKKHAVEYGEAANKASKATKDFLLGIDELNVINDSAGGAGSALEDYGSMFEEVEIDQDQFDWANQIREAIENGEWRSVGELVANKLNEVVDSWDSYGWGKRLGELINNGLNVAYGFLDEFDFKALGSKIADALNGIFDGIEWDLLGRTFAAKWNALFDFVYGFSTTLEWHKIGLDIAEAINGFLDELDAERAAEAVSKFVTGLFDMLNTAISETHWDVLGDKLAQFMNGVDWYGSIYGVLSIITNSLDALKKSIDSFLAKWQWKDTAKKIYTAINKAFSDVNWNGIGETLSNAFTTVFNFLRETIDGISWEEIGSDVADALNGIEWDKALSSLATAIASALNGVVSTLSELVSKLEWEKIGDAIGVAINDFFEKFDFEKLFTGLINFVRGILKGITAAIDRVDFGEIGKKITGAIKNIDWIGYFSDIGTYIATAFTSVLKLVNFQTLVDIVDIGVQIVTGIGVGIGKGIIELIKGIGEWFGEFVQSVKDFFGISSPSKVFAEIGGFLIEGLLQGITDTWVTITTFFQNAFGPIISIITGAWDIVKILTSGNFAEVGRIISDAWSGVQSDSDSKLKKFVSDTGTSYKALHTETENKFGEIQRSISKSWGETGADTKQKWSEINSSLNGTWDGLRSNADTRFSGVKQTVTGAWSEIEAKTESSWSSASRTISEKMGDIKSSIERPFTGSDGLIAKASTWGRDLVKNLADGMERNKNLVDNAARMTARGISSYLHFTEPDVGPLSDFHTYMPDMLELMSKGIKDNTYKAVNAASQLADSISGVLGNVEPVQPQFASYPTPQITEAYTASPIGGRSISNYSAQEPSSGSNDYSSAIYAAAGMIVEAIQKQDNSVYLDGKQLMKSVERSQKERGANIMGGGVLN